jgi:hypothetical protein
VLASVAWGAASEQIRVAFAEDAAQRLARSPEKTQREVPFAEGTLSHLDGASFVIVAQPERLDARRAAFAQPVVLAWGKKNDAAYFRATAKYSSIRELLRKQIGM